MRKLSCILPLLLLLFLGLCACQGKEAPEPAAVSVDWQRLEKGTRTDQENWNRWTGVHLPYDLAAFSNAPDRVPLSDPGSLRLQDAMGVTPERATVDGVVRVWGTRGGAQRRSVTPDGGTLITQGFTSLWVSTPSETWQEADYCYPNHFLTPDGTGLLYGSGQQSRQVRDHWQLYWCDLTTGQTTQLTRQEAFSYEPLDLIGKEEVLCKRVRVAAPREISLVVVDRAGKETVLELPFHSRSQAQAKGGYLLYQQENGRPMTVYRWTGDTALSQVCTLTPGGSAMWDQMAFSPDGTRLACPGIDKGVWFFQLADLSAGSVKNVTAPSWERVPDLLSVFWESPRCLLVGLQEKPGDNQERAAWQYPLTE